MAKEDFLECVVKEVELHWPRLNQPYRFNNSTKRTEPCAATAQGAAYSVSWNMDNGPARELWKMLRDHFDACAARNSKIGKFTTVFGYRQDDDGTQQFTAKRNAVNATGREVAPPPVVDGHKRPLADTTIWSGSIGSVAFSAVVVSDPDGQWGIKLLLSAVQVIEAKYGSTAVDQFEDYEDAGQVEHQENVAGASDDGPDIPF